MPKQKKKTAAAAREKKKPASLVFMHELERIKRIDQREVMMELAQSHYGIEREWLIKLIVTDWLAEHAPHFPTLNATRQRITEGARQAHDQAKADAHQD